MKPKVIKQIRNKLGLKQEEFADALGVARATVARWETGVFKPSKLAVAAIKLLAKCAAKDPQDKSTTKKGE